MTQHLDTYRIFKTPFFGYQLGLSRKKSVTSCWGYQWKNTSRKSIKRFRGYAKFWGKNLDFQGSQCKRMGEFRNGYPGGVIDILNMRGFLEKLNMDGFALYTSLRMNLCNRPRDNSKGWVVCPFTHGPTTTSSHMS